MDHYGLFIASLVVNTIMVHKNRMIEDTQMKIRLSKALKEHIEASAIAANRSLNAEIVFRLQASYPDQEFESDGPRRSMKKVAASTSDLEAEIETLRREIRQIEVRLHAVERRD